MMARDWVLLNLQLEDAYFAEIELGNDFKRIRQKLGECVKRTVRKGPSGEMKRERLILEANIEMLAKRTRRMVDSYKHAEVLDPQDRSSLPQKEVDDPFLMIAFHDIRPSYLSWDTIDSVRSGRFCDFPMRKLARDFEIQKRAEAARIRTLEVAASILAPLILIGALYVTGHMTDGLLSFVANVLQVSTFFVVILMLCAIASRD